MINANTTAFKDVPNQHLVEAKLKPKNVREISKEEALVKYKRNAYTLGRIFSYENDGINEVEDQAERPNESLINEDMISSLEAELQDSLKRQNDKLNEYKEINKKFFNHFHELRGVKDHESLQGAIEKLKKDGLYAYEHPFLNELSPFYLSNDDTIIKPVTPEIDGKNPSWDPNDNVQLISL